MSEPRYTLKPGRIIARDGATIGYLGRMSAVAGFDTLSPAEADAFTRDIVAKLNAPDVAGVLRQVLFLTKNGDMTDIVRLVEPALAMLEDPCPKL